MRTTREKNARKFVDDLVRETCFSGAWCTWYENEALQEKLDLTRKQLTDRLKNAEDFGLIKRFENGAAFRRWHEMEGVPGHGLDPKGPKNMNLNEWTPRRVIVFPERLGERLRPEGLYGPLGLDTTHKDSRVTLLSPEADASESARVTKVSLAGSRKCDSPGHESVTRAPIRSLNLNLEGKETTLTLNVVGLEPSGTQGEREPANVRRVKAEQVIEKLRAFKHWKLTLDDDGRIRPEKITGHSEYAPIELVRELVEPYRAEIVDLLREAALSREASSVPRAASAVADGPRKPWTAPKVPPVPPEVQANLRGLGRRVCGGDADAVPELAAELCKALLEKNRDLSMKTYLGFLGEVAAGTKPPDMFTAALDAALTSKKDNPGEDFTGCVKRLSGESHRRREGSRPASPHHA